MHTVTEIEERIRQRYRQPKGVSWPLPTAFDAGRGEPLS